MLGARPRSWWPSWVEAIKDNTTPSPSGGRLGWGWGGMARPIPTLTLPLKGRELFLRWLPVSGFLIVICGAGVAAETNRMRLLDGFDDLTPWKVSGSDEVKTRMRRAADGEGGALCMDYDFGRVSGYAVAARELPLEFPGNYEFVLRLRGQGPPNSLQFKLVDTTGENVWWVHRPDYVLP